MAWIQTSATHFASWGRSRRWQRRTRLAIRERTICKEPDRTQLAPEDSGDQDTVSRDHQGNRVAPCRSRRLLAVFHHLEHAVRYDGKALEHEKGQDAATACSLSGGGQGKLCAIHVRNGWCGWLICWCKRIFRTVNSIQCQLFRDNFQC